MTGFQIGSDLWLNVIPGVKVGGEVKGGIFGNHATQRTHIFANSLPGFGIPAIEERASDGRTAYLTQASLQAVYRITYSIALRGSYQCIYVDNVALGPENVNDEPPALFLPNSTRTPRVSNDGRSSTPDSRPVSNTCGSGYRSSVSRIESTPLDERRPALR